MALLQQIKSALAQFASETRLYQLSIGDSGSDTEAETLLVEAFCAHEEIQGIGVRDVIVLSTNAFVDLHDLLGQSATLGLTLADGSRSHFSGEIAEAAMLGSEGGLARYRLRLRPWLWRLGQCRNSRVWQDKSVIEIVDSVFEAYMPLARWRWSDETASFMTDAGQRSYCSQYRESDLAFVTRLLTEEGLSWRFEQTEEGVGMVLFADSSQLSGVPEDLSSVASAGIRFQGARVGEAQDTVQSLQWRRTLAASMVTRLSYDYKAKKAIAASSPTRLPAIKGIPVLESYDVPGQYAHASAAQAQHYADIQMQGLEARAQGCSGRSTVRSLRAGTRLTIMDNPRASAPPAYTVWRVSSVGINNLPAPARQGLAELFGPIPELLEESRMEQQPADFALTIAQAVGSGYGNSFEAVASDVIWRPQLSGSDGRSHPRPTALGSQTAIVIGPDGADSPNGADELYCDQLGRVRIRFHWQDGGDASCWVRVAQRAAGGGMGSQFLPRIGQEILVQFIENDIDRPIIVGALYNGRGEGGIAATPGGGEARDNGGAVFAPAHDHMASAKANLAGGNSPLWHGASADSAGHRNNAAQWGVRSKEFGASGYNQLLFDDTDAQGRIQLKTSHAGTELNLGHLIHGADNYRGSLRGQGAELRTDAYGAVRAGAGLLVSSYALQHGAAARDPAGDNAPGIALVKQAVKLAETFSGAAATHQTVALATHVGADKATASALDDGSAPLKAMLASVSGMVGNGSLDAAQADAAERSTAPGAGKLPYVSDSLIAIAAKAGLGVSAGMSLQWANGETATAMSGADSQFVSGGQMRVHSGQAIGVLSGTVQAGEQGLGLQLISAKGAIDLQAQTDELKVQARDEVSVISSNAHIDWAAAKRISISTAGGANITIDGGNITVQAPGKIAINAGKKSFIGPGSLNYPLPKLPKSESKPKPLEFDLALTALPGPLATPLSQYDWQIVRTGGSARDRVIVEGRSDNEGKMKMTAAQQLRLSVAVARWPNDLRLLAPGIERPLDIYGEREDWSRSQQTLHALAALDFSNTPGTHVATQESQRERTRAAEAIGESSVFNFFKKFQ
ncbi:type VI secretion system tip protein VgrG [Oxalobacteraceae bacterium]|nr:type VI secretion system tip protein VgrG [Oxalobacteraceae bacterium]